MNKKANAVSLIIFLSLIIVMVIAAYVIMRGNRIYVMYSLTAKNDLKSSVSQNLIVNRIDAEDGNDGTLDYLLVYVSSVGNDEVRFNTTLINLDMKKAYLKLRYTPNLCHYGYNGFMSWMLKDKDDIIRQTFTKTLTNSTIPIAVDLDNNDGTYYLDYDDIFITSNTAEQKNPDITSDNNHVYIVYQDNSSGNYDIKLTYLDGNQWITKTITSNPANQTNPKIFVYNSRIYVVWVDNRNSNNDIYFAYSDDLGDTWNERAVETNSANQDSPSIYVYDSKVYLVWRDLRNSEDDIFGTISDDNGNTFRTSFAINTDGTLQKNPDVVVNSNGIYVVYQDTEGGGYDIYLTYSTDDGNTWQPDNPIFGLISGDQIEPRIKIKNNRFYMVWSDARSGTDGYSIYYSYSDDGTTWQTPVLVSNAGGADQFKPDLTFNNKNFPEIIWYDNRTKDNDIYMIYSLINNDSFILESSVNLNKSDEQINPRTTLFNNTLFVVYQDNSLGNFNIKLKALTSDFFRFNTTHINFYLSNSKIINIPLDADLSTETSININKTIDDYGWIYIYCDETSSYQLNNCDIILKRTMPPENHIGYFSVDYINTAKDHKKGSIVKGETARLCFALPYNVSSDSEIRLQIITKKGFVIPFHLYTPNVISEQTYTLYPAVQQG